MVYNALMGLIVLAFKISVIILLVYLFLNVFGVVVLVVSEAWQEFLQLFVRLLGIVALISFFIILVSQPDWLKDFISSIPNWVHLSVFGILLLGALQQQLKAKKV